MSKIVTGLLLTVVLVEPALAICGFECPRPVPAPEVTGGIVGMVFAAGVAYLLARRNRTKSQ